MEYGMQSVDPKNAKEPLFKKRFNFSCSFYNLLCIFVMMFFAILRIIATYNQNMLSYFTSLSDILMYIAMPKNFEIPYHYY